MVSEPYYILPNMCRAPDPDGPPPLRVRSRAPSLRNPWRGFLYHSWPNPCRIPRAIFKESLRNAWRFSQMDPPQSGAGVRVGMLRGAGDSFTWKYKSYKISISCFQTDMQFISKMLKMFLRDLHHLPVPVFIFSTFQNSKMSNFEKTTFQKTERWNRKIKIW